MEKYIIILIILISCNSQDFLISSTYQHWVGGRPETGKGINYKFKLIALDNNTNFQIKKINAHGNELNYTTIPEEYSKGDTLIVSALKSKKIWKSDTNCEINYSIKGKCYSISPKDLIKLDKLFYP